MFSHSIEQNSTHDWFVRFSLRNPYPLVQDSRIKFNNPYTDRYKRCSGRGTCLAISVGKHSIHRLLLIMDALIKSLESRGYEVFLSGEEPGKAMSMHYSMLFDLTMETHIEMGLSRYLWCGWRKNFRIQNLHSHSIIKNHLSTCWLCRNHKDKNFLLRSHLGWLKFEYIEKDMKK